MAGANVRAFAERVRRVRGERHLSVFSNLFCVCLFMFCVCYFVYEE